MYLFKKLEKDIADTLFTAYARAAQGDIIYLKAKERLILGSSLRESLEDTILACSGRYKEPHTVERAKRQLETLEDNLVYLIDDTTPVPITLKELQERFTSHFIKVSKK